MAIYPTDEESRRIDPISIAPSSTSDKKSQLRTRGVVLIVCILCIASLYEIANYDDYADAVVSNTHKNDEISHVYPSFISAGIMGMDQIDNGNTTVAMVNAPIEAVVSTRDAMVDEKEQAPKSSPPQKEMSVEINVGTLQNEMDQSPKPASAPMKIPNKIENKISTVETKEEAAAGDEIIRNIPPQPQKQEKSGKLSKKQKPTPKKKGSRSPKKQVQNIMPETQDKSKSYSYTYPTFLVILKSPRSGSTFLDHILNADPNIRNLFEPTIAQAAHHFQQCKKETQGDNQNKPFACSVSFNDYLNENRYENINSLIRDYQATIVIQLRANVVEKAISASKLWGGLKKSKVITPPIATSIRNQSRSGLQTIRGFVNAEKFMPFASERPPIWVWYEDLVRDCIGAVGTIHQALGLSVHESALGLCEKVHFRDTSYNEVLVRELRKDDGLIPMIDAFKYNMEVDTNAIYDGFRKETDKIKVVKLGFWR